VCQNGYDVIQQLVWFNVYHKLRLETLFSILDLFIFKEEVLPENKDFFSQVDKAVSRTVKTTQNSIQTNNIVTFSLGHIRIFDRHLLSFLFLTNQLSNDVTTLMAL